MLVLGAALALLAVIGLAVDRQATLLWFDAIAAMISIGGAFIVEDEREIGLSLGLGPMVIGLGLIAVFIAGVAGLAGHQPAWAVWANFVLGCASLALGVALTVGRRLELGTPAHW